MLEITNKDSRYVLKHGPQFEPMMDARDKVLEHDFCFKIAFSLRELKQVPFLKSQLYVDIMENIHNFLVEAVSNIVSVAFNFLSNKSLSDK